jgi:hypothetical protein
MNFDDQKSHQKKNENKQNKNGCIKKFKIIKHIKIMKNIIRR